MPKGLIVALDAEPKSYKTSTMLSGPLPIVALCYDLGYERAIYGVHSPELLKGVDFDTNKHIVPYVPGQSPGNIALMAKAKWKNRPQGLTIFECPLPLQDLMGPVKGMKEVLDYSQIIAGEVIKDKTLHEGTLAVDTATLLREFAADAHLQNVQKNDSSRVQLIQIEYGKVNDKVRDLFNAIKASGMNCIVTYHMTDERVRTIGDRGQVTMEPTGKRIPKGVVDRDKYIDIALYLYNEGSPKSPKPKAKFILCGFNETLIDDTFDNPTWNRIISRVEVTLGGRIKFIRREVPDDGGPATDA